MLSMRIPNFEQNLAPISERKKHWMSNIMKQREKLHKFYVFMITGKLKQNLLPDICKKKTIWTVKNMKKRNRNGLELFLGYLIIENIKQTIMPNA